MVVFLLKIQLYHTLAQFLVTLAQKNTTNYKKFEKKCFEKEKSTVPNSRPKFARPSLILNIRSKSSLEINFSSESLRQGVKNGMILQLFGGMPLSPLSLG